MTVIYHSEVDNKMSFVIFSAEGKAMITQGSLPASGMHSFDVSTLSKGFYHVVMYAGKEKISKKFVKE